MYANAAGAQQRPEGLFINSRAPEFKAKDQNGNEVSLKELRKKGPVVLLFYRGYWCPFCNKELRSFQDSLQLLQQKGAQLIAVTPESAPGIDSTISRTGATFPILFDEGLKITNAYNGAFKPEERLVNRYKSSGVDLAELNRQKEVQLPVPAVYIVNKDGDVSYRFFDENYRNRPSVQEILKQLK